MRTRWVLATGNRGKLEEIAALLDGRGIELLAQSELGIAAADETAPTFVENALIKARHAARQSGLPSLADDSGLTVDALGGAPGVLSARYAGPDADDRRNVERLLEALRDVPERNRAARFHCVVVALRHPDDPAPVIATGTWPGRIAVAPSGRNGFGYDPVFLVPALGCTAAELAPDAKNAVSHRGAALRALAAQLEELD
ncbi:MAG: RdgB/HAM1 family non-canonical purine NTP pyrophosphatase [Gammaproteobacteria bacterium]|nr:RdgB/HAM1 family non-canonical purine NTP pyrophosphatase [Gammaproteobacteria bacterium]